MKRTAVVRCSLNFYKVVPHCNKLKSHNLKQLTPTKTSSLDLLSLLTSVLNECDSKISKTITMDKSHCKSIIHNRSVAIRVKGRFNVTTTKETELHHIKLQKLLANFFEDFRAVHTN